MAEKWFTKIFLCKIWAIPNLQNFQHPNPCNFAKRVGLSVAIPRSIAYKISAKLSQRLLRDFHCNPYCEKRDTKKFTFILSFRRNLNKVCEKVNLDSFGMTNFAEILKHQFLRQIMQQLCVNNFCANCRLFPMSAMSTIQNVSFNICFIRKCF